MSAQQIEEHIPFLGSLLKNEQDTEALQSYADQGRLASPASGAISARSTTSSPARRGEANVFLDLFYGLRKEGLPVSIQEWQMLMTALEQGLHGSSLLSFYHLARATLVKSETYFDAFDRVFARVFHGVEGELSLNDELEQWLNDPKQFDGLTDEQREALQQARRRRADAAVPRDGSRSRTSATTAAASGSAPAATRPSATAASIPPASAWAARAAGARP